MALTKINRPDSQKALFGTGDDLSIYHSGSHSFIDETGTGGLSIRSGDLYLRNPSDADMIHCQSGGYVKIYYDGSKKFETLSDGVKIDGILHWEADNSGRAIELLDNQKIFLGTGTDLKIYHDGSNTFIEESGTGSLFISSNQVKIRNANVNEEMIVANENGAV